MLLFYPIFFYFDSCVSLKLQMRVPDSVHGAEAELRLAQPDQNKRILINRSLSLCSLPLEPSQERCILLFIHKTPAKEFP